MEEKLIEILNKMSEIHYGWVDKYKVKHTHSKKDFYIENYRLMSVEDTINNKIGTCFEQNELCGYYLDKENIEYKKYIIIYDDPNKIARHTICIVNDRDKYYLMESSWFINGDHFIFNSTEDILKKIISLYPKMYKIEPFKKELIHIYEYKEVIPGMTYDEFCNKAKESEEIKISL